MPLTVITLVAEDGYFITYQSAKAIFNGRCQRFEICSRANEWNDAKKALKLPTLLEGEALAVWIELTDNEQKDYTITKKKIINAIMPIRFVSLADFHKRMLMPGESLSMYVHQLKQLLNQAMPDISAAAKKQLLFHQFLSGLPQEVSKQRVPRPH